LEHEGSERPRKTRKPFAPFALFRAIRVPNVLSTNQNAPARLMGLVF